MLVNVWFRERCWVGVLVVVAMLMSPTVPAWAQDAGHDPNSGTQTNGAFCQDREQRGPMSVDVRGLAVVYCTDQPVVAGVLKGAHATSYPVFYGAVPAAWAGAWALRDDGDFTDAYRLTLTQLATYGLTVGLKRVVGRPRPFVTHPLSPRSDESPERLGRFESFPSGHASLSVALATSWSLSHPHWYVILPGATWAGAVTLSRLYLGVHYPSDVLTGALLGGAVATGIHLLRGVLTPKALTPDDTESGASGPGITMTIRF